MSTESHWHCPEQTLLGPCADAYCPGEHLRTECESAGDRRDHGDTREREIGWHEHESYSDFAPATTGLRVLDLLLLAQLIACALTCLGVKVLPARELMPVCVLRDHRVHSHGCARPPQRPLHVNPRCTSLFRNVHVVLPEVAFALARYEVLL